MSFPRRREFCISFLALMLIVLDARFCGHDTPIRKVGTTREKITGKEMPILLNIEPKTMRGYTSYGMILAADSHGSPVLFHPAQEVPPGSVVR